MKAFELDLVARHESRPEKEIKPEIAFRFDESCYYVIRWNEASKSLDLYKAGFPDDRIIITCQGANKISIQ